MRNIHVNLLCALALCANASVYTVDDLIAIALKSSPDINVSRLDVDISQERVNAAKSYRLPSLNADLGVGYGGAKLKGESFDNATVLSGTLSASQLLYDFGKTSGAIDGAISDVNASSAQLKQAISDKIFEVKNGYYKLLQNRSLLRVNYENIELNEQQLYRSKRYFEAGIRTKIDITDANVRLIEAQLALQDNGYAIKLDRINLEKIIGLSYSKKLGKVYEKELNYANLYETLPTVSLTLEDAEAFAYEHRNELKSYAYAIETAKAYLHNSNADYYPGIYATGEYFAQQVQDRQLYTPQQQYSATVNAKWNLFSGYETDAKVQEAKIALLRSKSLYENSKLSIKQEVGEAYIYLFKNRDAVKLSQSLSIAAKEKHIQAQKRYEHGLSDYIELQQARQNYIDSLASLVRTYYDYYRALAALDRAMGR
ncbi:MAG: TolC family protein [Campylobacterota bacterium]|nr:TolC family protein [Campylobacterota bacterium]